MIAFFIQAFAFLIRSLFDLIIFGFLFRFILQCLRANFFNPVAQLMLTITDPLLIPARRHIPSIGGLDTACLVIIIALTFLKLLILFVVQYQHAPNPIGLILWAIGDISSATLYFFFFAILAQAFLSWLHPMHPHPMQGLLSQITAPLMDPMKKCCKPIKGFDLSPLPLLIGIQLLIMIIATPLIYKGMALAY